MSEFVYLFRIDGEGEARAMAPERMQQSLQTWMAWIRSLDERGHLRAGGQPLQPAGKVVRGPDRLVTDGPYVEVKDYVNGFILVEAKDLEEAAELARDCPMVVGGGSVEVRPIAQFNA